MNPSFLKGYKPYIGGLKTLIFHGFRGPRVGGGNSNMFLEFSPLSTWGR